MAHARETRPFLTVTIPLRHSFRGVVPSRQRNRSCVSGGAFVLLDGQPRRGRDAAHAAAQKIDWSSPEALLGNNVWISDEVERRIVFGLQRFESSAQPSLFA